MAHVIMSPLAQSLLHKHTQMAEIYVITKGYGELRLGGASSVESRYQVAAGSVIEIPASVPHMLQNKSGGHLEHLVFALPPFDSSDIELIIEEEYWFRKEQALSLPKVQDCFDGARILPYSFPHLDLSLAFGWVINDPARRKKPHYHKRTDEFMYVVEGKGFIKINDQRRRIYPGDYISISKETEHGFSNESPEDMVVVCVCSPAFQMEDVNYRS
jgi:mannose-6-phosphate isomerase-like protein (cupin superfamily)